MYTVRNVNRGHEFLEYQGDVWEPTYRRLLNQVRTVTALADVDICTSTVVV